MDFKLQRHTNHIDVLGNHLESNNDDQLAKEMEEDGWETVWTFSDYKMLTIAATTDRKDDDVDVNVQEEDISDNKSIKDRRGVYNRYSEEQKQSFWQMVAEEGCSVYKAALLNGIKFQTANTWRKNWNRMIWEEQQGIYHTPKKRGRKPILTDEHREFLKSLMAEDDTVTLNLLMEKFREAFGEVEVSASTVYKFVTKDCKFSFKRERRYAV